MLNKRNQAKRILAKYFTLIPALALGIFMSSCADETPADADKNNLEQTDQIDEADKYDNADQKNMDNATEDVQGRKLEGTDIYEFVAEMPEFPGGESAMMSYLGENIDYPKDCQEEGIEGTVYVSFVIDAEGIPGDIKVVKSPDERLSANAAEVVKKMPKWTPGKQDGKNVKVQYSLPIKYQLN